jgi:hypothetical protein
MIDLVLAALFFPVSHFLISSTPVRGVFVILLGYKAKKRLPHYSHARNHADLALCCVLIGMPTAPVILFIGSLIARNPSDPTIQLIEAIVLLNIGLALFFGGLAKFPWMRKAVAAIQNRTRTLLTASRPNGRR